MLRQYALVTGASDGIGASIARELAKELDEIFICSGKADEEGLMRTADDISAITHLCRVIPITCDVTSPDDVKEVFDIVKQYSYDQGLDFLVNNARICMEKSLSETTDEDWESVIAANLSSAFYCCREASVDMKRNHHGRILNISSMWRQSGCADMSAYAASMGGLDGLTKSLAQELAPWNIQVNSLSLGPVFESNTHNLSEEETASLTDQIPAGRMATTTEAAKMAVSILRAPDYLTGQIIRMDGGYI